MCIYLGVSSPPGCPVVELSTRMPKNPDEDTGVTDEINLGWSVPDDDGGYPITGNIAIRNGCLISKILLMMTESLCFCT